MCMCVCVCVGSNSFCALAFRQLMNVAVMGTTPESRSANSLWAGEDFVERVYDAWFSHIHIRMIKWCPVAISFRCTLATTNALYPNLPYIVCERAHNLNTSSLNCGRDRERGGGEDGVVVWRIASWTLCAPSYMEDYGSGDAEP